MYKSVQQEQVYEISQNRQNYMAVSKSESYAQRQNKQFCLKRTENATAATSRPAFLWDKSLTH